MAIGVHNVSKRFGDFVALDDVSLAIPTGSLTVLLGPSGSGKSTLLRVIAGLEQPDSGEVAISGRLDRPAAPEAWGRLRLPALRLVQAHDRSRQHRLRHEDPEAAEAGDPRPRRRTARARAAAGPGRSLPVSALGRTTAAHGAGTGPGSRAEVLLLDEPFGALDARVRKELRAWLRRLHDEVHVTTVLVTHDQEEAMEVADRIAVVNQGRIEQYGKPRDLYEHPATEFVMTFVGPVTRFGEAYIRPHDLEVELEPNARYEEATVEKVVHLGFEVRVELALAEGDRLEAQLTKREAERLELLEGQRVFVRPSRLTEVEKDAPGARVAS